MIIHNGQEYEEFTSDKAIIFDTPQPVLVWDEGLKITGEMVAYIPACQHPVITSKNSWLHCARPCAPRRVTNKELSMWCAAGNGQVCSCVGVANIYTVFSYAFGTDDEPVNEDCAVRRFGDDVWHTPTAEYLGIKE